VEVDKLVKGECLGQTPLWCVWNSDSLY